MSDNNLVGLPILLNCSHCLDLTPIDTMVTDGQSVLCSVCCATTERSGLLVMKEEYLCEICQSVILNLRSAEAWDGASVRSLVCEDCAVQYTRERSRPSMEELRDIIGDS